MRRVDSQPCDEPATGLPEDAHVDAAVSLLSAIAHPVRLLVLIALRRQGSMSAGQLQALAGIEQSAMSHQLKTLRTASLIDKQRRGRQIIYHLRDQHVAHIVEDALTHVCERR